MCYGDVDIARCEDRIVGESGGEYGENTLEPKKVLKPADGANIVVK